MSRRFLNPAPVLHDILGIDPAFNGSLTFYDIGTTDPKDTFADHDLTILNQNPVPLDSSGRSSVEIWLDGEYTAVLRNAADEVVWTRDLRPEADDGETLPAKEAGKFLTTDGTNWLLEEIVQVPDPTGFNGRLLSTDGANLLWIPPQEIPEPEAPDIVINEVARSFRAGTSDNSTKFMIQTGTGSASANGTRASSATITFPTAYAALWHVDVTVTVTGVTSSVPSGLVESSVSGWTAGNASSGVTANFRTVAEHDNGSDDTIISPVAFSWVAFGLVTVS